MNCHQQVFSGDNFESASPIDPIFWVIHPTLERLLHAKLISGGFADESWGVDPIKDNVCVTPSCYRFVWHVCMYGMVAEASALMYGYVVTRKGVWITSATAATATSRTTDCWTR